MRPIAVSRRALLRAVAGGAAAALVASCSTPAPKPAVDAHAAQDGHGDLGKLWADSGGDDLLHGKTFQALFNGLAAGQKAFEPKDNFLRCIDEGCPGGLHMAGSGVLNPNWEADLKGKIGGVYSHE